MATRFKNGVVKYFKDNIGIIIALVAMFIFHDRISDYEKYLPDPEEYV